MPRKPSRTEKIQKVLDGQNALSCYCNITPDMTDDELMALRGGCTSPQFSCPTLDAVRRVAGTYDRKEDDLT